MRYRPRIEQLESRDTPSTIAPASAVVSFLPNTTAPGVPFSDIRIVEATAFAHTPGPFTNATGYDASTAAFDNAGVYGAPAVAIQPPLV